LEEEMGEVALVVLGKRIEGLSETRNVRLGGRKEVGLD
jgi:hypothetical protein